MSEVLVVRTGHAIPEVRTTRGDYDAWIAAGLGLAPGAIRVVDVAAGETLPAPDAPVGVVVTGSSALVTDREDWSERTADWLARAVRAGTPVLGICYGHQLLAHGLGGEVGANPRGREIGTVEVRLLPEAGDDALLGALPRRAAAHATHVQSVLRLPEGAVRLAESDLDPVQAARFAPRAWGVQFHPEFDAAIVRAYLAARRARVLEEGLDADALEAAVRETPEGPRLLRRFAALVREGR